MFGRITPIVRNLLLINIAIFVLGEYVFGQYVGYGALYSVYSDNFLPFQFLTYMFLHGGLWHLFGNMFGLFVFGPMLERFWGSRRFLVFYLVCGIGAGALFSAVDYVNLRSMHNEVEAFAAEPSSQDFNLFMSEHQAVYAYFQRGAVRDLMVAYEDNPDSESLAQQAVNVLETYLQVKQNIPMVGASGALFGIIMAFGLLFPNTVFMLLFPPIPVKAKYIVMFYGAYSLWNILQAEVGDNVAHLAHLAGMLVGFILVKIWSQNRSRFY